MPISDSQLDSILNKISEVNHYFNEDIKVISIEKTQCPDCDIDPVTNESVDAFCPTCDGSGYIEQENIVEIPASVEYESEFEKVITKIGEFDENKIVITLDIEEIDKENIDTDNIDYIEWHSVKYKPYKKQPNYLEGILYEVNIWVEKV